MATAGSFIFKCMHLLSHCFSCGHTRPQTAGKAEVCLSTAAAPRMLSRSMFLIKSGMLMCTGHPSTHDGLAQSRQRCASCMAISFVNPLFTSSRRVVALYSGSSSGICTRFMAMRSLGFMALRSSARQGADLSVSSSAPSSEEAVWQGEAAHALVEASACAPVSGSPSSCQC